MTTLDDVSEKRYRNPVAGFTKLFSSLIFSTVWREEMHVKVVWITMLAMANRHGDVLASVPGLADAARVSIDQCREALFRLGGPDPDSRTKENEGRRIIEVDGGWRLLNYPKYREIRDADERRIQVRENVRAFREREKAKGVTVIKVSPRKPKKAQAEAEAEAEVEKSKPSRLAAGDPWVVELAKDWATQYHGTAPFGQIGKHLKPLVETEGFEPVRERWQLYLSATEARYASPARFSQTFGSWDRPGGAPAADTPISEEEARVIARAKGVPNNFAMNPEGYRSRADLEIAIAARLAKVKTEENA